MNKNITKTAAIFAGIILIVLFINAQYNKVNLINNTSGQIYVNGSLINGTDGTNKDDISQRDQSFLRWAEMVSKSMTSHVSDVANATKIDDYDSIEKFGISMRQDATLYLNQSKRLEISPMMKPILEDIKKSLENYQLAGEYLEKGGSDRNNDSLYMAAGYAEHAENYMKDAIAKAIKHSSTATAG